MYHSANSNGKLETGITEHSYILCVFESPFLLKLNEKKLASLLISTHMHYSIFCEVVKRVILRKHLENTLHSTSLSLVIVCDVIADIGSSIFSSAASFSIFQSFTFSVYIILGLSSKWTCTVPKINSNLTFPSRREQEGIFVCTSNPSLPITAGFPYSVTTFYFLHDRGCAKVWNIYEGVQDGAPFQDLPLWLGIRAFSSALNNSCSESICLVRFIFFLPLLM